MKLTKVQKEFFLQFTRNAIQNLIISQTHVDYLDIVKPVAAQVAAEADLDVLSQALGEKFLENIDFKTLKKVDQFLKSPEYQRSVEASAIALAGLHAEVGAAVQETASKIESALAAVEASVA